jgi:hypothetical protein
LARGRPAREGEEMDCQRCKELEAENARLRAACEAALVALDAAADGGHVPRAANAAAHTVRAALAGEPR